MLHPLPPPPRYCLCCQLPQHAAHGIAAGAPLLCIPDHIMYTLSLPTGYPTRLRPRLWGEGRARKHAPLHPPLPPTLQDRAHTDHGCPRAHCILEVLCCCAVIEKGKGGRAICPTFTPTQQQSTQQPSTVENPDDAEVTEEPGGCHCAYLVVADRTANQCTRSPRPRHPKLCPHVGQHAQVLR